MRQTILIAILLASSTLSSAKTEPQTVSSVPKIFKLEAIPSTVAWGYYGYRNTADKPALFIDSGDTVVFDTLLTASPADLEAAGMGGRPYPEYKVQDSLRDIYNNVTHDLSDPKIGVHILTGPVYIRNAAPGNTLEVRIKKVKLAIPYAYNRFKPKEGLLPEDFPYVMMKIIPLDEKHMVADFAPNIKIPLRPFFGSMGVAPSSGYIHSAPPGIHGGNIDNKELVAGTTLYLPVHANGALFEVGDGHAGQGNGDVDITELVDGNKVVHVMMPKAIFTR